MKPGAFAIIQVPVHVKKTVQREELTEWQAKRILVYDCHLRAYGPDFKDTLEDAGFGVEVNNFVKEFTPQEIKRYGLDRTEDLYICRK